MRESSEIDIDVVIDFHDQTIAHRMRSDACSDETTKLSF